MQQFSIKNDEAVTLLEKLTQITGKGKTELVLEALQAYQVRLRSDQELEQTITSIRENVQALMASDALGRAPGKEEIEDMLGMP